MKTEGNPKLETFIEQWQRENGDELYKNEVPYKVSRFMAILAFEHPKASFDEIMNEVIRLFKENESKQPNS